METICGIGKRLLRYAAGIAIGYGSYMIHPGLGMMTAGILFIVLMGEE